MSDIVKSSYFVNSNFYIEYYYNMGEDKMKHPYSIHKSNKYDMTFFSYADVENTSGLNLHNISDNTLILDDINLFRWRKASDIVDAIGETTEYKAPVEYPVDYVKIWFPKGCSLNEQIGIYFQLYVFNKNEDHMQYLSSFFYDKSLPEHNPINLIESAEESFLLGEKVWDRYIELYIPSAYYISKQVDESGLALPNSLNFHLRKPERDPLATEHPLFIDVGFVENTQIINGVKYYYIESPNEISFNQMPIHQALGVEIKESEDGDFFNISGTYAGDSERFEEFIDELEFSGVFPYIIYETSLYEQNIKTDETIKVLVENISDPINYRPIIKYSSTTVLIRVIMKIIDYNTGMILERKASKALLYKEFAKYAKRLERVKIENGNNITIYKNPPQNRNLKRVNQFGVDGTVFRYRSNTFFYEFNRISIKNQSESGRGIEFLGQNQLMIYINPYDNVFKFTLVENVTEVQIEPLDISGFKDLYMVFRNENDAVRAHLMPDTSEINLVKGNVVFRLGRENYDRVKAMAGTDTSKFYIVGKNEDNTQVAVYSGNFDLTEKQNNN